MKKLLKILSKGYMKKNLFYFGNIQVKELNKIKRCKDYLSSI
jgi:hypothetical protein